MSTPAFLRNEFDQPIGLPVPDWVPCPWPPRSPLTGRYCRLEPLDPERHGRDLFTAQEGESGATWTYMPYGPFADFESYRAWMDGKCRGDDPLFYAIFHEGDDRPTGVCSYLRITPAVGVLEVGHLYFTGRLRQSRAATEAMFLMMQRAFDLGYRRYEWKCDVLNAPSRQAALRLGLRFEGIFRQATIYKGRTRDTAWYAAIDADWPDLKQAFLMWLDPANFDAQGRQRVRLSECQQRTRASREA